MSTNRDATNLEKNLDLGTNPLGLDLDLGLKSRFGFGVKVWIWLWICGMDLVHKTKSTFKSCKSTTPTKLQTVYTMNPYITNPNPNPRPWSQILIYVFDIPHI